MAPCAYEAGYSGKGATVVLRFVSGNAGATFTGTRFGIRMDEGIVQRLRLASSVIASVLSTVQFGSL